jgi:hypothetical protein
LYKYSSIPNIKNKSLDDTTLCDKVCQWLATGQWFSPGTPVSSTNKTDRHDITEILLKVVKIYFLNFVRWLFMKRKFVLFFFHACIYDKRKKY